MIQGPMPAVPAARLPSMAVASVSPGMADSVITVGFDESGIISL